MCANEASFGLFSLASVDLALCVLNDSQQLRLSNTQLADRLGLNWVSSCV